MQDTGVARDTDIDAGGEPTARAQWARVGRDVLVFQFKLVVDGFKDLFLAQVALGAAVLDLIRRDGTPGRRFYGIVRFSHRFEEWIDLYEPLERVPDDAPDFTPGTSRSVDDLIDGVEASARTVAVTSARVATRGVAAVRGARDGSGRGHEALGGT